MSAKEKRFIEITLLRISNQNEYEWKEELDDLKLPASYSFAIERLFVTYIMRQQMDFLSHLRQVSIYNHSGIKVPQDAFKWANAHKNEFCFNLDIESNEVSAKPRVLENIPDLDHDYQFSMKRKLHPSMADPTLLNIFEYEKYMSTQQKMMIHTLKKMEQGSTLLACLPTGSGKSLLWQYGVATGKFSGTVIVIVPTNALGTDHVKSDKSALKKLPWVKSVNYSSEAYRDSDKLLALCEQIEDSEQLILYISPEGLTNTSIKKAILKASAKHNLSAVIIDEAHLIVDWGMKFRPEFQFLPGLIKQIKYSSGNKIYTVLLSATFTENDRNVLLKIFGDDKFYEYRGDKLRPEISYYRHHCKSESERRDILLKLVAVVPKPAIVYVGTVKASEEYELLIHDSGFKRVARFNGDTKDAQREKLISDWRNNKIDIMVATSAFGMGVDKADVRTVITAYTPENISRYYQEVGRSGRDGFSSLNFVLFCPQYDSGVVSSNTDKKLISTENLWKRWKALQDNATVLPGEDESDCYVINTDTKHEGLTYEITGGYNSGWNDNVVSMLARAGYISILDVWRKGNSDNHKAYFIKVRVNDFSLCFEEEKYIKEIDEFRQKERDEIVNGKDAVNQLLSTDDWGCYANVFKSVFNYPGRLCGGCPYCRKNNVPEYHEESKQYLNTNEMIEHQKKFHYRNFASVCTDQKSTILVGYENKPSKEDVEKMILRLAISEANVIVLENTDDLDIKDYRLIDNNSILILGVDELMNMPEAFACGTIVYFLGENELANNKMLKYSKKCLRRKWDVNQIFIANVDYYWQDEKRMLVDCVEDVKLMSSIIGEEIIC